MTNEATETKRAFYFGCTPEIGHYLHGRDGGRRWILCPGIPWALHLMDGGFLRNGKVPDQVTGKVYWTCAQDLDGLTCWHAFYWWDRSVDSRPASNSGFYVCGFGLTDREGAFAFACEQWPAVVERQHKPLWLVRQPQEEPTERCKICGQELACEHGFVARWFCPSCG